jgi:hypothetical protein
MIGGGLVAVVAGVGLLLADGGDEAVGAPATPSTSATTATTTTASTATTTATTATTAPPTTTTTVDVDGEARAFFAAFADALRGADAEHLLATLHPLVAERYGAETCRAYLGGLDVPAFSAEVLSVEPAGVTFVWETDGLSTEVPDAVRLVLRRTEDGSTFVESDVHLARVDGGLRWFTDCGTPGGP